MKPFNQEQLDILQKWEESFFTATVAKYYRNIATKSLETIKSVYDQVADEPYPANWSCNHCILAFLRTVGKKYFEDRDALVKKATELVKAMDEVFDDVEDIPDDEEPKPKKTTKKKPKDNGNKETSNKKRTAKKN